MRLADLLFALSAAGIRVSADDGALRLTGKTMSLTSELTAELTACKPVLLHLLPHLELLEAARNEDLPCAIVGFRGGDLEVNDAVLHVFDWMDYLAGGDLADPDHVDYLPVCGEALVTIGRWYAAQGVRQ